MPEEVNNHSFETLKCEYVALRAEIVQSISKQHQILLGAYTLAGAAFGYLLARNNVDQLPYGLAVIPFIFLAMASLWAVECNRMVRASYYIADVLWDKMRVLADIPDTVGWETWIRLDERHPADVNAKAFENAQAKFQQYVVVYIPICLSVLALLPLMVELRESEVSEKRMEWGIALASISIASIFWYHLHHGLKSILSLKETAVPYRHP